ncbi:MAG: AAA family ATPase [Pseudomonadota bacterium]
MTRTPALLTLAVSGYRSLRELVVPLEKLTVITGANGTGKSSLYRSLKLLADVAQGEAIASLAGEGGLSSTLWAGPEAISKAMRSGDVAVTGTVRKERVALKLGFAAEDYGYAVDLGLPTTKESAFSRDPEIKCEALWAGETLRKSHAFARRNGGLVQILDQSGKWRSEMSDLPPFESMMTHAAGPTASPELLEIRERMKAWRFYDHLRTDRDAPARQARVGTRTVILANDGSDLAAAVQTIREIGDHQGFDEAIDDAFLGSTIEIAINEGLFSIRMRQRGLLRPLDAAELSDGTLRYLLLTAALFTPRPPPLLVLNEPETSLHPSLIKPLARQIQAAARNTQIIVVTHADGLVRALQEAGATVHGLEKDTGETCIKGSERLPWSWPAR